MNSIYRSPRFSSESNLVAFEYQQNEKNLEGDFESFFPVSQNSSFLKENDNDYLMNILFNEFDPEHFNMMEENPIYVFFLIHL